jgi:DNA-binding PadR family transcriptional regulator
MPTRHRAKWTVPELNNLHNEYEIKELTVQQIAVLHNRTIHGILNKLQSEGLIDSSWENARGWVNPSEVPTISLKPALQLAEEEEDEEEEEEEDSVAEDDPDDEDYVPEEEEEDDEEPEEEEDFDPYSMKQKVEFLEKQIANIYSLLEKYLPAQKKGKSITK